ncbi:MAG: TPM domain-containing protein [Candidatus Lustribacter sp.]|jgi:uncharacterized membrane protein
MVSRRKLHRFVDKARIRAAIAQAEAVTSAPIHVSVAPYFWGDVRRTAERALVKQRKGVLIFVVPSRREFAIVGDAGAHDALGQEAWDALAGSFAQQLRSGDPTAAITSTIAELARALAASGR